MPGLRIGSHLAERMRKFLGNAFLLAASVLACLLVAEAVTRWADGLSLLDLRLPEAIGAMGLDTTAEHLDEVPRAKGVERAWFFSEPPPLPNRSQPQPNQVVDKNAPPSFRSNFRPEDMFKAWNAVLVGDPCKSSFFRGAPGQLYVFDPPDGSRWPIYRFLPNTTTPVGLVTNQFGWRGPPIPFKRSPNTVRIVFVGASTTADAHAVPYSYPEVVGHWLNLWAAVHRPDIRFEVLNAGRESVASPDIAAIVREEVAPLHPDLVIYYEGANQFRPSTVVKNVPVDEGRGPSIDGGVDLWLRHASSYLALARRMRALLGIVSLSEGGREPPKPDYKIDWPEGLDEFDPDLGRADLPVSLSIILHDLDRMRTDLAAVDCEFSLSSFMWLVRDGMVLNPIRNRLILDDLNIHNFPFRYRDLERLAAFQNRVFAKYAAAHNLPFIDIAHTMPFDPDLFADAIHNTYPGIRMKAWVVFQQLVPIIEKHLATGIWPKPAPVMGDSHPAFAVPPRQIKFDCPSQ